MFTNPAEKIMYCYGVYQDVFDKMERELGIMFHDGLPSEDTVESFANGARNIIILDDLMHLAVNSTHVQSLFTKGSHHKNLTIIYLNQNMYSWYCQGKAARTTNLNTHYMVLLWNPRDTSQVGTLAKQTGLGKSLLEAYGDCTHKPYGYLVVDLSPHSHDQYALKTDIFPNEDTIVYVPI